MASSTKLVLWLLTLPTLVGASLLSFAALANANSSGVQPLATVESTTAVASCDVVPTKAHTGNRLTKSAANEIWLDFSAAESDASVILFGCDCPSCIGALRQLRRQSLIGTVQGHCWAALSQTTSPETIEQVLEAVNVAEELGQDAPLQFTNR